VRGHLPNHHTYWAGWRRLRSVESAIFRLLSGWALMPDHFRLLLNRLRKNPFKLSFRSVSMELRSPRPALPQTLAVTSPVRIVSIVRRTPSA
jgi:hypothetical protein